MATAAPTNTEPTTLDAHLRAELKRLISAERARREHVVQDGLLHGTEWQYRKGCRCQECRTVASQARARRSRRGLGPHNRDKTECVNGHPFTAENTYRRARGDRECLTCKRERARRVRAAA